MSVFVEVLAEINVCTMLQVGMILEIFDWNQKSYFDRIQYKQSCIRKNCTDMQNFQKYLLVSEKLKVRKLQNSGRLFHIGFENVADEGTFRKGGLGGLGGAIFSLSFFFGRGGGLKIASFD